MKRFFHGLLAVMLVTGSLAAKTYSDKTFLMPRSNGMNMAMEYTGWHKHVSNIDKKKFGGSIEATGFYEESNNDEDLGKYFGVANWNNGECCVNDFYTVVPNTSAAAPWHHTAVDLFHLGPNAQSVNLTLADKLIWRPDRHAYGVRLDYHQKLDKIVKGLFFRVSAPIVHVKTSLNWTSSCDPCAPCSSTCDSCESCDPCCRSCGCENECDSECTTSYGYCVKQKLVSGSTLGGAEKSVADYLTGHVSNDDAHAKQVALCKGKIHNGRTETGIADIDVIIGYNFLYKPTRQVSVNAAVTIPTGNTPDAEYLWEPVVGNAGHWALGAGMDAKFQIWKSKKDAKKNLEALFAFNYRYLFNSTEKRILGFVWPSVGDLVGAEGGHRALYGHWILGAKLGDTTATPMANFLARDVRVTPGSHFEGIAQGTFNWGGWTFDLGYNLYAKEAENVRLKNSCGTSCCDSCETTCEPCGTACNTNGCGGWANDTYGIIKDNWDTAVGFAATNVYGQTGQGAAPWINCEHLCTNAAETESVVTHKIYGGINYSFDKWEYPLLLGIGGSYEWETDNDCLDGWALWAKLGLSF